MTETMMKNLYRHLLRLLGVCVIVITLGGGHCYENYDTIYYAEGHGYVVRYDEVVYRLGYSFFGDRRAFVFNTYEEAAAFIAYLKDRRKQTKNMNSSIPYQYGPGFKAEHKQRENGEVPPIFDLLTPVPPPAGAAAGMVNSTLDSILQQPAAAEPQ